MATSTKEDALALLDGWAEGQAAEIQQAEEGALSQEQMKQLWNLINKPRAKSYLDTNTAIPR